MWKNEKRSRTRGNAKGNWATKSCSFSAMREAGISCAAPDPDVQLKPMQTEFDDMGAGGP
jgi:hypothetical protein